MKYLRRVLFADPNRFVPNIYNKFLELLGEKKPKKDKKRVDRKS